MDGHFWIVRDGEIIDPYFKDYDMVKVINNLEGDRIYLPAGELIQKVMKKKYIDKVIDLSNSVENSFEKKMFDLRMKKGVMVNNCNFNAVWEQMKNGGEIVFGSMGWKRKNGKGIHYEFGGENWTISQFLNK
jgi:hypothetical protein